MTDPNKDLKNKTQGFKNYSGNDDTILKKLEIGNVS